MDYCDIIYVKCELFTEDITMKKNNHMPDDIHFDDFGTYQCLEDIKNDSVDLCLITCGMEKCFPCHSYGPAIRDVYVLHFITDGYGYVEENGELKRLGPNDVFLVYRNQISHYYADETNPWTYMWVGFLGLKAPAYIRYAGFSSEKLIGHFENCLIIKSYIQQIITCRTYTVSNELKRNSALMEILALLIDNAKNDLNFTHHSLKQEYIEQAKNYIDKNIDKNLSVNAISESIGINRSYLTRIFKEVLNIAPQEYIKQFRINRGALLLQNPNTKIAVVARSVGYSDSMTFSKLFKAYKGMTPTEYRQMIFDNSK